MENPFKATTIENGHGHENLPDQCTSSGYDSGQYLARYIRSAEYEKKNYLPFQVGHTCTQKLYLFRYDIGICKGLQDQLDTEH